MTTVAVYQERDAVRDWPSVLLTDDAGGRIELPCRTVADAKRLLVLLDIALITVEKEYRPSPEVPY